jgi:hypothetical protein
MRRLILSLALIAPIGAAIAQPEWQAAADRVTAIAEGSAGLVIAQTGPAPDRESGRYAETAALKGSVAGMAFGLRMWGYG